MGEKCTVTQSITKEVPDFSSKKGGKKRTRLSEKSIISGEDVPTDSC